MDSYGDNAISFSNQFLASIFGIVAGSALVQQVLIYLLNSEAFSWELGLQLSLVVLLPSGLLFAGLLYIARYTFKKFTNYSSLTSTVAGGKNGIYLTSRLDKLYFPVLLHDFEEQKTDLEKVYNFRKESNDIREDAEFFVKSVKVPRQGLLKLRCISI